MLLGACSALVFSPMCQASKLVVHSYLKEKTYNLFGGRDAVEKAVKETEEKFGNYWPRNIMILFGPPGTRKVQ